jgi:LysM repeat protein
MRNRTVWLVTGVIFLLVLGGVFYFFDYMGVNPEDSVEEEPQVAEIEEGRDEDDQTEEEISDLSEDRDEGIENSEDYIVQVGDTVHSIATAHNLEVEDLRYWNNLLDPQELEAGTTLSLNGPSQEQAQKEEWQITFEFDLYDQYKVTVSEYEFLDGNEYAVYVNEVDTGSAPYATVHALTGEYTVN